MKATAEKMVKVQVHAEQMFHSVDNGDGTHTTRHYRRGDVFLMPESEALSAAEGELPGKPMIIRNSAGTDVWGYPPKTPGAARAAVEILKEDAAVPISAPMKSERFVPAPEPKAEKE